MSRINLLPWREARRKELKTRFFTMIGVAALLAAGIWGIFHLYHTQLIEHQIFRNTYLEQQIKLWSNQGND